jgi:RHS repeat-associated protein
MEYTFTGQASYMDDPITSGTTEGFGLMFFNARWLDPAIGRFAQADSIVPPGVQGYDRYAYGLNNPSRYTDPTGHESVCGQANSDPECGNLGHSPLSHPKPQKPEQEKEDCKGLECIHSHNEDNDITLSIGIPTGPPKNCVAGEKCDKAEALAGVFLIASVDLMEAVFVIIGVLVVGPMAIVPILEVTSPLWIPANLVGAYLIFDSGVVKDFNRTAWGLK